MATIKNQSIVLTDRNQIAWLKWQLRNPSGISEEIKEAVEREKTPEYIEQRENMLNSFIQSKIKACGYGK